MDEFDEWLLAQLWHPMLRLDPPYRALRATWARLVGHQIGNRVAFELYGHALNGWMIHASDFGRHLQSVLEQIKQHHRHEFRRNRWRDISADHRANVFGLDDPELLAEIRQRVAIDSANRDREQYKKVWDQWFPTSREKGVPSHDDINVLKERLARIGKPLRDHRNTVAAHPEATDKLPAAWRHVNRAFVAQRAVVTGLYFLKTRGSLMFDLPDAEREAEAAAEALANIII